MKKVIIAMLMALCMVVGVFAAVTPITPNGAVVTNDATYDFSASSDMPITYWNGLSWVQKMDLLFNGATSSIDCVGLPCVGTLNNYPLPADGLYDVSIVDGNSPNPNVVGSILVDTILPSATGSFSALGNDVSYTVSCADAGSGVSVERAEYSTDSWVTSTPFDGVSPDTLPNGVYDMRVYCEDFAGNLNTGGDKTITLPANPADLLSIDREFPNHLDGAGVPSWTVGADGSAQVSLRFVYDSKATITGTINGLAFSDPAMTTDHVVTFNNLYDGTYNIVLTATDEEGLISVENVALTITGMPGTPGTVDVTILGVIPVDLPTIAITGAYAVKSNAINDGTDWVVLGFDLTTTVNNAVAINMADFVNLVPNTVIDLPAYASGLYNSNALAFCESDYNPLTQDYDGSGPTIPVENAYTASTIDCSALGGSVYIKIGVPNGALTGEATTTINFMN